MPVSNSSSAGITMKCKYAYMNGMRYKYHLESNTTAATGNRKKTTRIYNGFLVRSYGNSTLRPFTSVKFTPEPASSRLAEHIF